MSDNELDNLFKEAADGYKAPNDPSAWKDMSSRLDVAAVTGTFWNWKTISGLTVAGVASVALVWYLSTRDENESISAIAPTNQLSKVIPKNNTQSDNNKILPQAETNDGVINKTGEAVEKDIQTQKGDNYSKNTINTTNSTIRETSNASVKGSTLNADQKDVSSQQSRVVKENKVVTEISSIDVLNSSNPTNQSYQPKTSAVLTSENNNPSQSAAKTAAVLISENNNTSEPTADAGVGDSQKASSDKNDSETKIVENQEEIVESKAITKDEEALSANKQDKPEEDVKSGSSFAIKLAIAPDYTTVKSATPNSMGINYGVLVEYRISRHWAVATGGIWAKKIYSAYDVEYNGYKADWVDGDCRMWDIPLNVYYNFSSSRRLSFYASAGLSSYIMNEENYVFYYDTPNGVYDYPKQIKGENNEWFKTLNISAGLQWRMNTNFSFQFEPTLKAPLAGVGEGEVSLVSLGAFLNLRYEIPFNKSHDKIK